MKKLLSFLMAFAGAVSLTAVAENYSTEATITPHKEKGTYDVVVRISRLIEKDGNEIEELLSQPKINTAPGVPASLYAGRSATDADYQTEENVSVDVSWPKPGEAGTAFCAVTIKRGDKLVSKSKFQLKVENW